MDRNQLYFQKEENEKKLINKKASQSLKELQV